MIALLATSAAVRGDELDDAINAAMQKHQMPGLSLAVVDDGKIVKAQGYGFTDKTSQTPVTTETLFQAGSVSKPVAAFAVLHLVADGKLSLDADVNTELTTWKLPANDFTKDGKVTLRRILSHTAGLTVHGFPGYPADKPAPTLVDVLNGAKPAVTQPIVADIAPGTLWRYSGGGYEVMQQMVLDATKEPFPKFMRDTILKPLGMESSTYEQPPPEDLAARTAAGKFGDGHWVRGRWHVYPEMAAAGLWTTPSDLARFVMGVEQAFTGESNPVLTQKMTREMLKVQYLALSDTDGLGLFVSGSGKAFRFWHDGRNAGFDTFMTGFPHLKKGAVVMVNVNDDSGAIKEVMDAVAKKYEWKAAASNQSN